MAGNKTHLISALILAIVGSIYEFTPAKTIKDWGIGFLRHNDMVLFGSLCLIVAAVLVFKTVRR